jgi:hypothetical protein
MNPTFTDDRISAFLDGALPPHDAEEMRRHIQASPELATLVDELRTLRGEVQALPRMKAPADFTARIMAAVQAADRDRATTHPVTPARVPSRSSNWQSFVLGAVAASLVAFIVSYLLPSGRNLVVDKPERKQPETLLPDNGDNKSNAQVPSGQRTLELADLRTLLDKEQAAGENMYLARLSVKNSAINQHKLDAVLTQEGVQLREAEEAAAAVATAAHAFDRVAHGGQSAQKVREVLYLEGTEAQVRAALNSLGSQPMDVAHWQTQVVAVPVQELAKSDDQPTASGHGSAVRIGRRQVMLELGRDIGEGEGTADPNASSDVLVVIRVVK